MGESSNSARGCQSPKVERYQDTHGLHASKNADLSMHNSRYSGCMSCEKPHTNAQEASNIPIPPLPPAAAVQKRQVEAVAGLASTPHYQSLDWGRPVSKQQGRCRSTRIDAGTQSMTTLTADIVSAQAQLSPISSVPVRLLGSARDGDAVPLPRVSCDLDGSLLQLAGRRAQIPGAFPGSSHSRASETESSPVACTRLPNQTDCIEPGVERPCQATDRQPLQPLNLPGQTLGPVNLPPLPPRGQLALARPQRIPRSRARIRLSAPQLTWMHSPARQEDKTHHVHWYSRVAATEAPTKRGSLRSVQLHCPQHTEPRIILDGLVYVPPPVLPLVPQPV